MDKGLVLLTRPAEDSRRLAALLAQEGTTTLTDPMLHIAAMPEAAERIRNYAATARPSLQAVIVTSRHALPALADVPSCHSLPLFAVGKHTAEHAAELGFTSVHSPAEHTEALVAQLRSALSPQKGTLLYVSGRHVSMDIGAALTTDGFSVERIVTYEARAATALSAESCNALAQSRVAVILFYSLRTLEVFAQLAEEAGMLPHLSRVTACGLSASIASRAAALPWKQVVRAAAPNEAGLLQALRQQLPQHRE